MKRILTIATIVGSFAIADAQHTVYSDYGRYGGGNVDNVTANGWLGEFLNRQKTGMTGHPEAISYPFNSCLWAGNLKREAENHGAGWWRYEQTAYYTDGLLRLGYLLDDKALIDKGEAGIFYTLQHAADNGRLGPTDIKQSWPFAVFFRAIKAYYEATGDSKVVAALQKHYLTYAPEALGGNRDSDGRSIVNLEGILWTYGITKNPQLLELAEKAYALGKFRINAVTAADDSPIHEHGVTTAEMLKIPLMLFSYTGKPKYLEIALNIERKIERDHLLPDGIPSSAEHLTGNNPLCSHETCDISDFTWTWGYFLEVTGSTKWADMIETAIFNAGLGAIGKDFRSLQYLSSVNQVISTGESNHNAFKYGLNWMQYRPSHETECCAGNVHRFMPNYIGRMWLTTRDGGCVAALFGPSTITRKLPNGNTVTIVEDTQYPFDDQINFRFTVDRPTTMSFIARIPGWCNSATMLINGVESPETMIPGTFAKIVRTFNTGDVVTLQFDIDTKLEQMPANQGTYVKRGPLLFSFPVPTKQTIDKKVYANLNGKKSENPEFVCYDLRPDGDWNYGIDCLAADAQTKFELVRRQVSGFPFDEGNSPITIKVPAKKVLDWQLVANRFTPPVPAPGLASSDGQPTQTIELVPYGSTRLRLTVFPNLMWPRIGATSEKPHKSDVQ